jgi:hypothetical protein
MSSFALWVLVRNETHAFVDVARFALILATSIKFVGDNEMLDGSAFGGYI